MRCLLPSLLVAATMMVIAPASQVQAGTLVFSTHLSGPNEQPPNTSPGTGIAFVILDDIAKTMRLDVTFSGLLHPTTVAHIHSATAVPGVGTIGVATTVPTFPGFPTGVTNGAYNQLFDMTLASAYNPSFITANGGTVDSARTALFNGIQSGQAYLNIHTSGFPGGEIRGFFTPVSVPESSSTLGFLVLGTLGGVSWLKRTFNSSNSSAKETNKLF